MLTQVNATIAKLCEYSLENGTTQMKDLVLTEKTFRARQNYYLASCFKAGFEVNELVKSKTAGIRTGRYCVDH